VSNNDLYCNNCKSHHHPVECPKELENMPYGTEEEKKSFWIASLVQENLNIKAENQKAEMRALDITEKFTYEIASIKFRLDRTLRALRGLLDKGIKDIDALEFAELVIVTEQKHADRGTL